MDRKTKIIATVGPSLASKEKIHSAINSGVNVFRINFSHGTLDEHKQFIDWARSSKNQVAIMQDIQGPKIRTGQVNTNTVLQKSQEINLTNKEVESSDEIIFINYKNLYEDISVNDRVFIDDGQIILKITEKQKNKLKALILIGGELRDNQGVAFPDSKLSVPAITEQDIEHLKFGTEQDVDFVAVSFVRNSDDIQAVREIIPKDIKIIAKIELKTALENIDEILNVADGVMVARGDLGVQLPIEKVPFVQKQILDAANRKGKISITATEMLQSMKSSYRPTRAEVTDITNAILEGSDAVMLSAETSIGDHPNRVIEVMSNICKEVDSRNDTSSLLSKEDSKEDSFTTTLARAAVQIADDIDARAIVAFTETGKTPLLISNFRPKAEIITFSTKDKTLKQLNLLWGVEQFPIEKKETFSEMLKSANDFLVKEKKYNKGDKVIVVAGTPPNVEAATNLIRVHNLGDV
ncbi:pyruvate kinase [bacterium]|jgi:pyruvate kinase|nr:pyruvate kinase [bacterium]|tara:strand:- start:916 stop:2313 length:1398 start_codon:yes stop_codon:yes gene_type:complete